MASQLKLLKNLLSHSNNSLTKRLKVDSHPYKYLTPDELTALLDKCDDVIQSKECISKEMFFEILKRNSNRFDSTVEDGIEGSEGYRSVHSFINSICTPDIIEIAKANLVRDLAS